MVGFLGFGIFLVGAVCSSSYTPVPDTSTECLECQSYVKELDLEWTNETTVETITSTLKQQCDEEYNLAKKKVCEKVVDVYVQIPPGIFEGMDTLAWPIPLATCATFHKCVVRCCAADAPPEQIHLSLAAQDRSLMGVTWVTLDQLVSEVQYGTDPKDLTMRSSGNTNTYTAAGWIGTIHKAVMEGLKPSTTYYYRVGGDSSKINPWSEIYSFTTVTPGKSLTFAILADMAYDNISDDTVAALIDLTASGEVDCVIHSGDISYADGFEPHWDDFFNKIQPIAAKIPYMVTAGNHEFWYNFSAYKSRFFMPGVLDEGEYGRSQSQSETDTYNGSGDNMYYSWDVEGIHFISMNSETAVDTANFNTDEIAWATADLGTVDRVKTPWLIASFHRPMYCTYDGACTTKGGDHLRSQAEDLFFENKVDLVIAGHVHAYERTYPMYNNTKLSDSYSESAGPVYILQGASGNREGNKGSYPDPDTLADWSASQHNEVGYALMKVAGNTLDWTFYESSTRKVLDHVLISKS